MVNHLVSIIIPVYNVENYLKECLDSVINQSYENIEIICVNDGSTDNSLSILESYAKSDDRIRIFSKENGGQGAARNFGLEKSLGEYIYFVDADDYIDLKTIENFYDNAVSNDSEVAISKIARFNDVSDEIDYSSPAFNFEIIFGLKDYNNFSFDYSEIKHYVMNASFAPWTKFYKRDFLISNNITFAENLSFEDVPFHIKVMLKAKRLSYLPIFNYYYRFNPSSTVNTSEKGHDIFKIVDIVERFLVEDNYYDEFKNEFDLFKITQILNYMLTTKSEEYFKRAKCEFEKVNLAEDHLLDDDLFNRYEIVLNSKDYNEFEVRNYNLESKKLNYYKSKFESLRIYGTARIDMRNVGGANNSIEVIKTSDRNSKVTYPPFLKSDDGEGILIQTIENVLDLSLKAVGDGKLTIYLKGIDVRDKNDERFPIYINYVSFMINGEEFIENSILVTHDTPFVIKHDALGDDVLDIHMEWTPFNDSCEYVNELKLLKEKYDLLNKNYKSLNNQFDDLKSKYDNLAEENNKLTDKINDNESSKGWNLTKTFRRNKK